jgi:hypothetical protein
MWVEKKLLHVLWLIRRAARLARWSRRTRSAAGEQSMSPYTLTMMVSQAQTRLLLTDGPDELMRAALPPPLQVRHESAAPLLLQGIACWLDQPVRVVLSADAEQISSCLGLTDELGFGDSSLYYAVQAVERGAHRSRRGRRLRGRIGDFRQLHQLQRQLAAEVGAS